MPRAGSRRALVREPGAWSSLVRPAPFDRLDESASPPLIAPSTTHAPSIGLKQSLGDPRRPSREPCPRRRPRVLRRTHRRRERRDKRRRRGRATLARLEACSVRGSAAGSTSAGRARREAARRGSWLHRARRARFEKRVTFFEAFDERLGWSFADRAEPDLSYCLASVPRGTSRSQPQRSARATCGVGGIDVTPVTAPWVEW